MLRVTVDPGDGRQAHRWTLECDPPGGDHPDPIAACAALDHAPHPIEPVAPGTLCAQVYGGPQTAVIEGDWRGEQVHARYRRTDACETARWDAISPVLDPES